MYRQSEKNLLNSNISSTCPHNMVNLVAEIGPVVWGTPANFSGFRVLEALLHGTLVVGISQTLQRWTEGANYIRQGGHHVGHWPTFLVYFWLSYSTNNRVSFLDHSVQCTLYSRCVFTCLSCYLSVDLWQGCCVARKVSRHLCHTLLAQ